MRRSTGQALVEFALIIVPFFVVFFSIIEFALITASIGSYDFAGREAARIGSIDGKTTSTVDQDMLNAIDARTQGVVMAKTIEVDIFRANPTWAIDPTTGAPTNVCLTSGSQPTAVQLGSAGCMEDMYLYPLPSPLACSNAVQGQCPWGPDQRDDQLLTADYVGVRVVYQYTYITGFIAGLGSNLTLSTYSVQRIEPQDFNGFHYGNPPLASHAPRTTGAGEALANRSVRSMRPLALVSGPVLSHPATLPLWKRPDDSGGTA